MHILPLLIITIPFIYSNNLFPLKGISLLNNINENSKNDSETKPLGYSDLISDIFTTYYEKCGYDIERMYPRYYNIEEPNQFPMLLKLIGLNVNGIEDEIECLNSYNNTFYIMAIIKVESFTNPDDQILLNFLNLHQFTVSACATESCKDPLTNFADLFANFNNKQNIDNSESKDKEKANIINDKEEEAKNPSENKVFKKFFNVLIAYIIIKFILGIIRLIRMPKGYDKYVNKLLNENKIENIQNNENNSLKEKESEENKEQQGYNDKYDLTSKFPIYLRIWRFFDFFNDYMLLSTKNNRYYNDNGLEVINFLRAIVLYFYIFSTTFTTLLGLPSKDILNKAFFSSNSLFFYRFSSNATVCWIFLEAAFTSYKLMQFIKTKMKEYQKFKNYYIKLLIIFGEFILLFIPKICIFIFCYFIFYYDIMKFKNWFSTKTIYRYVIKQIITKDIVCENTASLIFKPFFTFTNDAADFKKCYDFTFVYINIFYYILIFIVSLYIIFVFRKPIIEIFFIFFYFVFFIGLMYTVDESNRIDKEKWDKDIYSYYHFKGQDYTTKIFYLAIGVYNLGFILGILCFHYEIFKKKWRKKSKNIKNNNLINENRINNSIASEGTGNTLNNIQYKQKIYYPLLFLYYTLKWYKKIKFSIKILIIIICLSLQIFIACFYKIYSEITKKSFSENEKNAPNFNGNHSLKMEFDDVLKFYFLFERHIFLILFFIISITLITLPKRGLFKKLIDSTFITAVSRAGFTIICLSYILTNLSFCGFIIKIKFSIPTFFIISIGNFLIIFVVCILINIVFELPLRIFIKKILRLVSDKKNNDKENFRLGSLSSFGSSKYSQK